MYSLKLDGEKFAKACAKEEDISPKDAVELCNKLKGMKLNNAKEYLKDLMEYKTALEYKRYKGKLAHKRGKGAAKYPVKAAKHILMLLEEVENNAEFKTLDPEKLWIEHINTSRGRITKWYRYRAYGRIEASFKRPANLEVIVKER